MTDRCSSLWLWQEGLLQKSPRGIPLRPTD
jgi:hypothetical protein